jgi:hypothetical protein
VCRQRAQGQAIRLSAQGGRRRASVGGEKKVRLGGRRHARVAAGDGRQRLGERDGRAARAFWFGVQRRGPPGLVQHTK